MAGTAVQQPSTSLLRLLAACALLTVTLRGADLVLSGRVVDENDVPIANAQITARPVTSPAPVLPAQTDPTGAFSITVPEPGDYLVSVHREGYYALTDRPVHIEAVNEVTWTMSPVREVFQSVNVDEAPSPVDVAQTRNAERLTGTEINDIPYPNSHSLQNSMKLLPGVLEDPTGGLHFNGSRGTRRR